MNRITLGTGLLLLTMACGDSTGASTWPDASVSPDAGTPPPSLPEDAGPRYDAGTNDDAAAPTPADDAGPGIVDYLTCKPDELNPLVSCLTVTCPMEADIISQGTCLFTDCVKHYQAISEKCRECVTAAVGQDVLGIVQSCVNAGAVLGDGGISLPF